MRTYGPLSSQRLVYSSSAIPWILEAQGDDAVWSGADLSSWPSRIGPTPTIGPNGIPQKGGTANGHQSVQFRQAQRDQMLYGLVHALASQQYTFQFAIRSVSYEATIATRQYLVREGILDTNDLVCAHIANGGGAWERGVVLADGGPNVWSLFRATNYKGNQVLCPATQRLEVVTYAIESGSTDLWEDLVLRGTTSGTFTGRALLDLALSGTKGAGTTVSFYDGEIFAWRIAPVKLTVRDIRRSVQEWMSRFGIVAYTLPQDIIDIFGDRCVYLVDFEDLFYLDYTSARGFNSWANYRDTSTHETTAGVGTTVVKGGGLDGRGSRYARAGQGNRCDSLAAYFSGAPALPVHMLHCLRNSDLVGEISSAGYIGCAGLSTSDTPRNASIMRARNGSGNNTRALRLATATRQAVGTVDPGTATHAIINSQDEATDVASTEIDGTRTDSAVVNCSNQPFDRFSWSYQAGLTNSNAGLYAFEGAHAVVVGEITAQERADFRTVCQAGRGAV